MPPGVKFAPGGGGGATGAPKKLKKLEHTTNRSLHLMELSRSERELHMETNATQYFFGAMLAERMMAQDEAEAEAAEGGGYGGDYGGGYGGGGGGGGGRAPAAVKQVYSELVRAVVATCPPESAVLDFRPFIEKMSDEDVWRSCGECGHATELVLAGWRSIAEKPLRAVSISLGDKLKAIDLSETPVGDGMLEALASRLFVLERLRLVDCLEFSNIGFRAITANCYDTLSSVDLSRSIKVDGETLGWLGGTMGIGRPPCKRLQTINAADCVRLDDSGLVALGKGCPRLAFANFSGCCRLSDAGVAGLAKGCPKLRVLSLANLVGIQGGGGGLTDKSLKAIGRRCKQLSSLNCARSGAGFTDNGIKALSKGCSKLQALNIAGAVGVTERGLMYIVDGAPGIGTLNLTGCQEITISGLRAAVEGNGYVTEARSYFGFFPKKDAVVAKLSDQQHMIEDAAARRAQDAWHLLLLRRDARAVLEQKRRQHAARVLQRSWNAYLHRDEERRERLRQQRIKATSELQRMYRGKMDRRSVHERLVHARWLNAQAPLWRRVQAAFRGFQVRLYDKDVNRMLVEVYQNRRQEGLNAAAVFTQATVRRFLARLRMSGWRELKTQRWRDRDHAARGIQATGRSYMAYRRRLILQVEAERIATLQNRAASRIQAAYRGLQGKYSALMTKAEIERLNRLRNRRALDCQRAFRGFLGREQAEMAKMRLAREGKACTKIQANWRMSRILPWQGIKMNKTAAFVFRREELEMDERAAAADERNARRIELAIRDSASDTEEEDVEEYWNEFWDDVKDQQAWSSTRTGEVVWEEPLSQFSVEQSMLNRYVRIFWPANDEWFRAIVSRFNKTKRRHRIEYPDGDHEWINFSDEADRVQVEQEDGSVVMFNAYTTPEQDARIARAAAKNAKLRAHAERERLEDFWTCVGWDKEKKKMRWQNEVTSVILYQAEDFMDWYRDDDQDGCIRYRHARTGRTADCTQPDPRFEKAEDSEATAAVKDAVKADLSMGVYLCSALMEEYYKIDDIKLEANKSRHQRRTMEKILTQPGYIKLRQALKTARMIYTEEDFTEEVLCVTGDQILKQYEELVEYGKYEQKELAAKKKSLLRYKDAYEEREVFHCPSCNRSLSGMPKMCGLCGGKIPNGLPATPKEDILEDGSRKPGTATWTQFGPPA